MHLASGPGIWAGPFASKAADDVLGPDGLTAEVITHMSSGDSSPSCFRVRAIGRMHDLRKTSLVFQGLQVQRIVGGWTERILQLYDSQWRQFHWN